MNARRLFRHRAYTLVVLAAALLLAGPPGGGAQENDNHIRYRQQGKFKLTELRTYKVPTKVIGRIGGREVIELDVSGAKGKMGKILTVDHEGYVWFLESGEDREVRIDPRTLELTEFQLPHGGSPYSIAVDSKGVHWITAHGIEVLLESDPKKGEVTAHVPPSHGFLIHINVDLRDDTVWFTMPSENKVVSFHRERGFKEYEIPTPESGPGRMDFDSKGRVWVPELYTGKLAVLDPRTGQFEEFELPTRHGLPVFCMVDKDDAVWVSEPMADKYARFKDGVWKEFDVPTRNAIVSTALEDYDGSIWFTEGGWRGSAGGNKVARLDPKTGQVEELALPSENAQPVGIARDKYGNIWFQQINAGKITRVAAPQAAQAAGVRTTSGKNE